MSIEEIERLMALIFVGIAVIYFVTATAYIYVDWRRSKERAGQSEWTSFEDWKPKEGQRVAALWRYDGEYGRVSDGLLVRNPSSGWFVEVYVYQEKCDMGHVWWIALPSLPGVDDGCGNSKSISSKLETKAEV